VTTGYSRPFRRRSAAKVATMTRGWCRDRHPDPASVLQVQPGSVSFPDPAVAVDRPRQGLLPEAVPPPGPSTAELRRRCAGHLAGRHRGRSSLLNHGRRGVRPPPHNAGSGRPSAWTPPAELPEPRQPLKVVGARPHPPPAVAPRTEPAPRPRRRFGAVVGLHRAVIDHRPAVADVHDEAGVTVAGAGNRVVLTHVKD